MRSDASKRRAAIVREARILFAARGGGVPLESVADAAGVGIATLYRNFESRSALADAVTLAILEDIGVAADQALPRLAADPGAEWHAFSMSLVDLDLGALTDALAHVAAGDISGPVRDAQVRTLARVTELLTVARAEGMVRADIDALELVLSIGMITRPQPAAIRAATPHLVPRLVAILEAGMRA